MQTKNGLIIVNTGPGKGKTTSALGAALRAGGAGLRVLIIQFIKGKWHYGELEGLRQVPGVEIRPMGLGLIKKDADLAPHRAAAAEAMQTAAKEAAGAAWDMLVLDEICYALRRGLVDSGQVVEFIKKKPPALHLILTGRDCPAVIKELATTVTRFEEEKHHFAQGIEAQKGIEF